MCECFDKRREFCALGVFRREGESDGIVARSAAVRRAEMQIVFLLFFSGFGSDFFGL